MEMRFHSFARYSLVFVFSEVDASQRFIVLWYDLASPSVRLGIEGLDLGRSS